MKRLLWVGILLCAGCTMQKPSICFPEQFIEKAPDLPGEEVSLICWWDQFHDPQLNDLIERAINSNYDLLLARERICEARAHVGMAASKLFPYIDRTANVTRTRNSETIAGAVFQGGNFVNFFQIGFDSIWEIDIFGKIYDRAQAAAYDVVAQQELVRYVHLSVTSEVATLYCIVRNLQQRIAITEHHIASEQALVAVVQERYDVGLIPALDVYTSTAVLDARFADLAALQSRLQVTIYSLAILLGEAPESIVHEFDTPNLPPSAEGKIPLGLPSELLCRRGDVRQAELAMYAAGARLLAARKELLPTLSLAAFFQFNSGFFTQWFDPASRQWLVNPSLFQPVFHGGHIRSMIRAENSKQRQAVLLYEQSILNALKEVESTVVAYIQQTAHLEAVSKEALQYKQARDLSEVLYIGGIVDFLYLIDSERYLYISEISKSESEEALITDLIAIYKALGGGWEC